MFDTKHERRENGSMMTYNMTNLIPADAMPGMVASTRAMHLRLAATDHLRDADRATLLRDARKCVSQIREALPYGDRIGISVLWGAMLARRDLARAKRA